MSRTVLAPLIILLIILVFVGGGFFHSSDSSTDDLRLRSIRALLPDNITGYVRVNLTRGTLLVVRADGRGELTGKMVTGGDPLLPVYFGWAFLERRTESPAILRSFGEDLEKRLRNSLN